jgi:O-antigen ligase
MNPYTITLAFILLISSLTDLVRRVGAGSFTALGMLTIAIGVGSVLLVLTCRQIPKSANVIIWLVAFLGLGVTSLYLNMSLSLVSPTFAFQNLLVYVAFVGVMLVSAAETYRTPYLPWYVSDGFTRSAQISAVIYGSSLLIGGFGSSIFMGARSFALYAIIALAWCLAAWRYQYKGMAIWAILLAVMVACSFSRTATVVTLVMFPLSRLSPRSKQGWMKLGLWVGLIATVAYLTFTYVEPIRERFVDRGDRGSVGGLQINTSGRDRIWEFVGNSIAQSPIIGKGPGSVEVPVRAANSTANGHPHNDYLRLAHDYGYLGLGLWLLGFVGLIWRTGKNWLWADRFDRATAHIHLAALLGLVGAAQGMLTDNIVVYIFAMAPLGILVGASIGVGSMRRNYLAATDSAMYYDMDNDDWDSDSISVSHN